MCLPSPPALLWCVRESGLFPRLSPHGELPPDCCLCALPSLLPAGASQPSLDMATPRVWVRPPFSGPVTSPFVTGSRWTTGHRQGLHPLVHELHKRLGRCGDLAECPTRGPPSGASTRHRLAPRRPARAGPRERRCAEPGARVRGWRGRDPGRRPQGARRCSPRSARRPTQGLPRAVRPGREVGGESALGSFLLCQQKTAERGKGNSVSLGSAASLAQRLMCAEARGGRESEPPGRRGGAGLGGGHGDGQEEHGQGPSPGDLPLTPAPF